MMESVPKPRRLKRLSEIIPEPIESKASSDSEILNDSSSRSASPKNSSSESKPNKNKQSKPKPAKNKAPKLQIFNKLLDFKTIPEEFPITEFEYLRDAPLEINSNFPKQKKMSFFSKVNKKTQDKSSYTLAKSVLTNKDEHDTLIVDTPIAIEGFIQKKKTNDPREIFRDKLKNDINERKTLHLGNEIIFEKSISELTSKEEIIEKANEKSQKIEVKTEKHETKSKENNNDHEEIIEKSYNSEICESSQPQAVILAEEKKRKSYPSTSASSPIYVPRENSSKTTFLEIEAEESGSESLENSETDSEDSAKILEDLIDDRKIIENPDINYSKHVKDMLDKEYEDLSKVVNANFKRKSTEELIIDQKKIKIEQSSVKPAPKPQVFSKIKDNSDSDEEVRFKNMQQARTMKYLKGFQTSSVIIDEKSNDYLKFIEKPEIKRSSKTLLNSECSKSTTNHVQNQGSNSHFTFSMQKTLKIDQIIDSKIKPKNKLLSILRK